MKGKESKSNDVDLERAEKLYARGNFSLALVEFEKIQKKLKSKDLADKTDQCRKHADDMRAKEFVKRARKAEKKGDLKNALVYFESAFRINGEAWISERIANLNKRLNVGGALLLAREAEKKGDFEKAAIGYDKVCQQDGAVMLQVKRAQCLVKAHKYEEAVMVFKPLSLSDPCGCYHYGFALAKIGHFSECLKVWENLSENANAFVNQKHMICHLVADNLYLRLAEGKDYYGIFQDADYLLQHGGAAFNKEQIESLKRIHQYGQYGLIEELWQEEKYNNIESLLENSTLSMSTEMLALQAKLGFKQAETDAGALTALVPLWLTAIYSPDIADTFGASESFRKDVRRELIVALEKTIRSHSGTQWGQQAATYLNIEREAIEIIFALVGRDKKKHHLVCTPLYANKTNKSEEILGLIRDNRDFFEDEQHYLKTGAYYSPAGEGLYRLKINDVENAMNAVEHLPSQVLADEFVDYGVQLICFHYGVACIENGDLKFKRYFYRAKGLLACAPDLSEMLVNKSLAIDEWDSLHAYEEALEYINNLKSSPDIRRTLSLVMIRSAIAMSNSGKLSEKALRMKASRSVTLYSENEMARRVLNDTTLSQEIDMVFDAIDRFKLGKATRLARQSQYPEVRESYFEFVDTIYTDIMESDLTKDEKHVVLNEVYEWAITVDKGRPIIAKMQMHLDL